MHHLATSKSLTSSNPHAQSGATYSLRVSSVQPSGQYVLRASFHHPTAHAPSGVLMISHPSPVYFNHSRSYGLRSLSNAQGLPGTKNKSGPAPQISHWLTSMS